MMVDSVRNEVLFKINSELFKLIPTNQLWPTFAMTGETRVLFTRIVFVLITNQINETLDF